MKAIKNFIYSLSLLAFISSCEQDVIDLTADDECSFNPGSPNCSVECPPDASAGSADFSKFVAIGSSFTAGFQAGALFNDGQNTSIPALMASKFSCVGGSATFNQPTIGTDNGFNIFVSPNPIGGTTVLGRFKLQGTPPAPSPVISDAAAIPNPSVNPAFIYTGSKTELNNFAVQATILGQALIPETGNWTLAGTNPAFNPFYARLASSPGASTMLTDMLASLGNGGTFYMVWLGMDDFLLHAVYGGDPNLAPLTPSAVFNTQYNLTIGAIVGTFPNLKGVLGNFPNIFVMPHFTAVAWNAIPLPQATADALNGSLALNYNGFLDAMVAGGFLEQAEASLRKISYTAGQNPILISDETLTDLSPYMAGPAAALLPYAQARQTKNTDIIPLSTGSVLGTPKDGNPQAVWGVSYPVLDQHVLIPSEIGEISQRITDYNTTIKTLTDANANLAYADVNKAIGDFVTARAYVVNGITITPNINPPTGIYSEDGLHPNSRGAAFIAGAFIDGINAKFGSTVPKPIISKYGATGLPINP